METEFEHTKTIDIIFYALSALWILAINVFIWKCPFFDISETALVICFIAMLVAFVSLCAVLSSFSGEITAEKNGIKVVTKLFGKAVRKKFIAYCDINCTYCEVSSRYYKASVTHYLNFTIKKKNGIKHIFSSAVGHSRNFDLKKFEENIHEQPLQKLCDFINEKIETSV